MTRPDGRATDALRPVTIRPDFIGSADGSVLIEVGRTRVGSCAWRCGGEARLAALQKAARGKRRR